MNPKDQQSRSLSKSTKMSSASPQRGPGPQNRGSVGIFPRAGSLASSWHPRVREKEKEQERLRRAAVRAQTEARAREFHRQNAAEISDNEKAEIECTDDVNVFLHLLVISKTDLPRALRSLPSRIAHWNQLVLPSQTRQNQNMEVSHIPAARLRLLNQEDIIVNLPLYRLPDLKAHLSSSFNMNLLSTSSPKPPELCVQLKSSTIQMSPST